MKRLIVSVYDMTKFFLVSFIILIALITNKCTQVDYYGNPVNINETSIILKNIERDAIHPDLFYIKFLISGHVTNPDMVTGVLYGGTPTLKYKKNFNEIMQKIMSDYGYRYYYTVDTFRASQLLNTFIFEVRFFKEEEEWDKWIERSKI